MGAPILASSIMYPFSIKLYLMSLSFAWPDVLGSMLHEDRYLGNIHCFQKGQFWSLYALHLYLLIGGVFFISLLTLGKTKGHMLELHNILFPEQGFHKSSVCFSVGHMPSKQAGFSLSLPGSIKVAVAFLIFYTNCLCY